MEWDCFVKRFSLSVAIALSASVAILPASSRAASPSTPEAPAEKGAAAFLSRPQRVSSEGSVTVRGHTVAYTAEAGTLVIHPDGWDAANPAAPAPDMAGGEDHKPLDAKAAMFYVAYFKKGAAAETRPITFVYNGGPGSATIWLHMGAFGPKRVVTADDVHTPAAPYDVVNNDDSLLDVTDLVFIDAPGTGFGRVIGKDGAKAFYGTDPDAAAFTDFIAEFLARHGRFNSPKYLFGESYGTTRSAIVADRLSSHKGIDLNGVILLSQILDYANSPDRPQMNPSVDQPYVLALPSYAATAWYHHKLPDQPEALEPFLREVEQFAQGGYTRALQEGTTISDADFDAVAQTLHRYTGLPVAYLKRADLRVNGGEFEKTLMGDKALDTGRLDSRFSGPSLDPLGQRPFYDPQSAAMESAYVAAFNDYVRRVLHFGNDPAFDDGYEEYKVSAGNIGLWTFLHKQPDQMGRARGEPNVLPDLADAMKRNPALQIMLNQGYFDLGTPYFEGIYEMRHLPIPRDLAKNIEIRQYKSGHMVYAHPQALHELHDNVAAFIERTHK
ncbi:peptidase S10 [Acidomonas methanolica]|nr:peptidase S10 [Acidomonas methanolica]